MGLKHKKYIGGQDGYCDKIIKLEERAERFESNLGGVRMAINKLECDAREASDMALVAKTLVEAIKVTVDNIDKKTSNLKWWIVGGIGTTIGLGIANNIFNLW
jgi:hypothetical protein